MFLRHQLNILNATKYKVNGKGIPLQAWTSPKGSGRFKPHTFQDNRQMKVVRLTALRTGRIYLPENIPDTRLCWWRSRKRHCATSRKVAGSIPAGVIKIFHLHNPSGTHYGLGVDSSSNRNEYQEYFLGGKGGRCVGMTTLPPSCADCLEICEPQTPGTLGACPGL